MLKLKKPVHPSYKKFMMENEHAMDILRELVQDTLRIYSDLFIFGSRNGGVINPEDLDQSIYSRLDPKTIDALKETDRTYGKQTTALRGCHNARDYEYEIHIFGYLKTGERSKSTLKDDLDISHVYRDSRTNQDYFDFNNAIMVGLFLQKDGPVGAFNEYTPHVHFSFDFSTVLVRLISSARFIDEEESLRNAIINTMLNKIIMFELSRPNMIRIMTEAGIQSQQYAYDDPYAKMPVVDLIKMMMIYKIFYNIINGLDSRDLEDTIEHTLGLVDLNVASMGISNGLNTSMIDLKNTLINPLFDVKRSIDIYIDELMNTAENAIMSRNIYKSINGERRLNQNIDNRGMIAKVQPYALEAEGELVHSILDGLGIGTEEFKSIKTLNQTPVLESIFGFESADSTTKTYQEFVRSNRASMISKLSGKERKIYLGYENEVLKLKSEAMNCETAEQQQAVIRHSESLAKRISIDLERFDVDSIAGELLLMLDTYRASITGELAQKNFINLAKNSLYGLSKYKSNFNL